jgi:hypothetical protein
MPVYISALTFSNQAFAQAGQVPTGAGGGGNGAAQPGQPINGGNGGDGSVIVTAFGSGALLGQSPSNSGHVEPSGLPGQIQTHPMQEAAGHSIITYLRAHGISTSTYIRNFLISHGFQPIYVGGGH